MKKKKKMAKKKKKKKKKIKTSRSSKIFGQLQEIQNFRIIEEGRKKLDILCWDKR